MVRDPGRPDETEEERADRNFGELLQELRVTQTGVQILFAFLLTIPFQARFERLDAFQRHALVAALVLAALATGCLIAPVAYHRLLFRLRLKDQIVRVTNGFALAGLGFLLLAVVASLLLALSTVLSRSGAALVAGGIGVAFTLLWLVFPLSRRAALRRHARAGGDDRGSSSSGS